MLIGIDVGTTHTKVAAYDPDGTLLADARTPTPRRRDGDHEHYAPDLLWDAVAAMLRRVTGEADGRVEGGIAAVGVASMGEAGVPLDAAGRPTHPILPWYDGRTKPQLERLAPRLPEARWFALTGLYPSHIYTLNKWLWLREHAPDAWARTQLWLSCMGFVRYRLTGDAAMADTQAARTMAFDLRARAWSAELLELADLDDAFLPPIVVGTEPVGAVTAEAARETGLPPGTPVVAGGQDHFCAALACGALTPELALDSQGTTEALTVGLPTPPDPTGSGGFSTGPHVIPGHSYLEGGLRSSGGTLRWVKETLGFADFEQLRAAAAAIAPGNAPLFVPHLLGAAPPFNAPGAAGAFVDLTPAHGAAHLARAVYEGIAFELRRTLDALERVLERPVERIRAAGGSAGDPLGSKIRAAILERPLEVAAHPDMVTLGAALLAGIGTGVYRDAAEAVTRSYRSRPEIPPDPDWRIVYRSRYARYCRTADALLARREES